MRVGPDAFTLLELAAGVLRDDGASRYARLMAAHAVETAARELRDGPENDRRAAAAFAALGAGGAEALCAAIREGSFDAPETRRALWQALWELTERSLRESSPKAAG